MDLCLEDLWDHYLGSADQTLGKKRQHYSHFSAGEMNTEELSGMSYILQTSEPDRGLQNKSPEAHFNPLLKKPKKPKPQKKTKPLKTAF